MLAASGSGVSGAAGGSGDGVIRENHLNYTLATFNASGGVNPAAMIW